MPGKRRRITALATIALIASLLVPCADAFAKGSRKVPQNPDGSGVFKPPAPVTNPIFVMAAASPTPKTTSKELRVHTPKYAAPSGTAMGGQAEPAEAALPSYPPRPVENLSIPLLFR